jgi:uncharacterized membrane protein YeaQ/YmgE (transglycosylase-associated protein family)
LSIATVRHAKALQCQRRELLAEAAVDIGALIGMLVVGLVVGLLARAIMPGTQSMGLVFTVLLGIAGSFVAGFLGQLVGIYSAGQGAGFIGSVVGALLVLFIVGKVKGGGSSGA